MLSAIISHASAPPSPNTYNAAQAASQCLVCHQVLHQHCFNISTQRFCMRLCIDFHIKFKIVNSNNPKHDNDVSSPQ